jgi:hypothetical protein
MTSSKGSIVMLAQNICKILQLKKKKKIPYYVTKRTILGWSGSNGRAPA